MNYIDIVYNDTANAPGISTVLFVSGCTNKCPECHNPQSWDFNAGQKFEIDKEGFSIVHSLANPHVNNFVISGGDPLIVQNFDDTIALIKFVKDHTHKRIIIYTGLEWYYSEDSRYPQLLDVLEDGDMVIDGPYIKELKTEVRDYRGSTNQRALMRDSEKLFGFTDISNTYFKSNI